MSVEYDATVDIGEQGSAGAVITEDNMDMLREMATSDLGDAEPAQDLKNKMEAPLQDKVNRKKQRSKKQMETFEKARAKRLENIKRKKAERKEREDQLASGVQPLPDNSPNLPKEQASTGKVQSRVPTEEEQVKELEEIQKEVLDYQEPRQKTKKHRKAQKIVYIESESSSEEEEVIYVKRRKPKKKTEAKKKVVYEDDYGDQAEFTPSAKSRRRSYKPVSFSDVFKYA